MERPFRERRTLLRTRFPALSPEDPGTAQFDHVNSCESEHGRERIEEFWQDAVESRCEGLMIKVRFRIGGRFAGTFSFYFILDSSWIASMALRQSRITRESGRCRLHTNLVRKRFTRNANCQAVRQLDRQANFCMVEAQERLRRRSWRYT